MSDQVDIVTKEALKAFDKISNPENKTTESEAQAQLAAIPCLNHLYSDCRITQSYSTVQSLSQLCRDCTFVCTASCP